MEVIKAPNKYYSAPLETIFLAGSIEMGKADDWQSKLTTAFRQTKYTFLNPRRDDWNSLAVQDISDPYFNEQVNWELDGIEYANTTVFYFDPATTSPITLLELGKVVEMGKRQKFKYVIVCCPDGYFRKGNVQIVCSREGILLVNTLEELIQAIKDI